MRAPTLHVGIIALCAGCADTIYCTTNIRMSLSGQLVNEAGDPVIPDAVLVRVGDEPARACSISPGEGYSCLEGRAGRAQVLVTLGERTWTKPLRIRDDADGCHNAFQQLDFVLDGVASCAPEVAVSGAIVGPDGGTVAVANIWLSRLERGHPGTSTPCEVNGQRYQCFASGYYGTQDYLLVLQSDLTRLEAVVRIPTEDCLITPVHHDFMLR